MTDLKLETTIKNDLPVIVQATIIEAEKDVGIQGGYEFEVYFPNSPTHIAHSQIPEKDKDRIVQELADLHKGDLL